MPGAAVDSVVEHDGISVAVRDLGGNGPDVLLLHGLGGCLAHWSLVAPLLLDRFRLVAMDLPGHGRSSVPAGFDVGVDVATVAAVQRALDLDHPAVVGHSYGGVVAVAAGAQRPDDHPLVMNVDGVGFTHAGTPSELQEAWRQHDEDLPGRGDDRWLQDQIAADERELATDGITGVPAEVLRGSYRKDADGLWTAMPPDGYRRQLLAGIRDMDLLAWYADTRCRTVTVLSRRVGDTAHGRLMIQQVQGIRDVLAGLAPSSPGGEVAEVASGHLVPLEAPAELARLIVELVPGGR